MTVPASGDLTALFPPGAALVIATAGMYAAPLLPGEDKFSGHAVETRRQEFAAGRAAARAALLRLGVPPLPIPAGADRAPQWPDGYAGSITHCDGSCGAVVARRIEVAGIGFDAETDAPLAPELRRRICSGEELREFSTLPGWMDWPKLAFSAKEAFYKCFFPLARTHLNFLDVAVRFVTAGENHGGFEIRAAGSDGVADFLSHPAQGLWLNGDGLVFTSFVRWP